MRFAAVVAASVAHGAAQGGFRALSGLLGRDAGLFGVICRVVAAVVACLGGRREHAWVVSKDFIKLSPGEQDALAECYLVGVRCEREAAGRSRVSAANRARISEGKRALSVLVESMMPLLSLLADEHVNSRIGHEWGDKERDDARSEAAVAAIDAILKYDSTRSVHVHQWVSQQVRLHLSGVDYDTAGGLRPREWRRVSKVAFMEIEKREMDGRSTSTKDVADGVYAHFYSETLANILSSNPSMTQDEADKATRERLSRQSITRAITKDMAAIMESSQMSVSLDAENDEGGSTLYDTVEGVNTTDQGCSPQDVVRKLLGTLSEEDIECVLSVVDGSVPQHESGVYASRHGLTVAQSRAELRSMSARLTAPHAQFAALSGSAVLRQGETCGYDDLVVSAQMRMGI